jgi:hypothetical protein
VAFGRLKTLTIAGVDVEDGVAGVIDPTLILVLLPVGTEKVTVSPALNENVPLESVVPVMPLGESV